jgi:hypothetical protein
MKDWTQDPQVIVAIRDYDVARANWLQVAPDDGLHRADASVEQDAAFARMRATDRAYLWARDSAIERAMWGIDFDDRARNALMREKLSV